MLGNRMFLFLVFNVVMVTTNVVCSYYVFALIYAITAACCMWALIVDVAIEARNFPQSLLSKIAGQKEFLLELKKRNLSVDDGLRIADQLIKVERS